MDMLKGMTKKGQAEWYLIGLVIAVIVLVVVVWGFYSGWKFVPDTFSNFPKLDVAAQSCGFLAAPGSSSDYCSVYKPVEINGGSQKTSRGQMGFVNFTDKNDSFQLVIKDATNQISWKSDNVVQNLVPGFIRLLPMEGPIFVQP